MESFRRRQSSLLQSLLFPRIVRKNNANNKCFKYLEHISLAPRFNFTLPDTTFSSSLPDHVPPQLHQQQRSHGGRSEPQRSPVHGDQPQAGVRLRVPHHGADEEGLGGGRRGSGGHHGEKR